MTGTLDTYRETALESPYSKDREEAIESLAELYPTVDQSKQRQILETLRTVVHESRDREERKLARKRLIDLFEENPDTAAPVVVPVFCDLATDSKFSDERLSAIDSLRELYLHVDEARQEEIGHELAEIAGNATYSDERRRARQRLTDITAEERRNAEDSGEATAVGYLAVSLAEHLENAADDSAEACRQRTMEIVDFLENNPVSDEAYDEIVTDMNSLAEQLEVLPTDGNLDSDRKERVCRLANRIERLYERSI